MPSFITQRAMNEQRSNRNDEDGELKKIMRGRLTKSSA